MKVKITQTVTLEITEEDFQLLRKACFVDGDRQMLHELIDYQEDELLIERWKDILGREDVCKVCKKSR